MRISIWHTGSGSPSTSAAARSLDSSAILDHSSSARYRARIGRPANSDRGNAPWTTWEMMSSAVV